MPLVIKKIIVSFLLPPGCLILLLAAFAVFNFKRSRKGIAISFLVAALLMWTLSVAFVSEPLLASLERGLSIPLHPQGDIIVLLGGGLYDRVPDLSGSGAPSEAMLARMVTAVRLQRRLEIPVLVSGGSVFGNRSAEAPVVKRFMIDLGVAPDKILIEDKSRDTIENARFSKIILVKSGYKKPILVTSAYHMRRSIEAFRKVGMEVTPVPSTFHSVSGRPHVWADWFPDSSAMDTTSTVLREYLGLIFYKLSGRGAS